MKCTVTIFGADGISSQSGGDLTVNGKNFCLAYKIRGDNCTLSYGGGTLTQTRRGELNTDISFKKNSETLCMLYSGELTGGIPVTCRDMQILLTVNGLEAEVSYWLGGAAVNLRLSAIYVKE